MRPAGKGRWSCFISTIRSFRRGALPNWTARRHAHPVAIVGAGPIGMTAALVLARYGIRSVLIDRKETSTTAAARSASRA